VAFDALDKAVLRIMMLAFVARVIAPKIFPAAYIEWIALAAACWFLSFALLAWRYIPYLCQARVDGKVH
jgi:uncharacterized protein involved in response to NO